MIPTSGEIEPEASPRKGPMVSLRIYRDEAHAQGLANEDLVRIQHPSSAGRGSTGNVLAALASFFVPGLGQLVQGRLFSAAFLFLGASLGYFLWFLILPGILGFLMHAASVIDAALWKEA